MIPTTCKVKCLKLEAVHTSQTPVLFTLRVIAVQVRLFASESTFYSLSYCMSDESLSKGNYKIENGQLVLNFGAKCVVRSYNYENEIDTSAVDFYMTDTLVQEISRTYEMKLCENKIAFTNNEHREMVIEVKSNFSERMAYLRKEGFLKQFEIIKN